MTSPPTIGDKAALRREALARRARATPAMRRQAERRLPELAEAIARISRRGTVGGFMAFRGEFDILPLMAALARAGRRVAIPQVTGKSEPLTFRRWAPGDAFRAGTYGIREPLEGRERVDPDIYLVPLAAFDRRGYRIGYGGGFYDRTLAAAAARKSIVTIGIAYSSQEVPTVPAEAHDIPLDAIFTERGLMETRR